MSLSGRNSHEEESALLPGWSALVILLTVFGTVSVIILLVVLRGGSSLPDPEEGGRKAFSPSEFQNIDFDKPLLEGMNELTAAQDAEAVTVPPPPFSDPDIFPCTECHADLDVNPERRELEMMHDEIELNHGPKERWCFDCHNPDNRDHLRLASGELIGFDESYRLCGQCHGTIYRDWRQGIHGQRRGYWNGQKSYLLCAHC
ncbi:MAG: hypothetical protein GY906_21595, partial [bacterium]|nr:hypothetical protein [bacterium]